MLYLKIAFKISMMTRLYTKQITIYFLSFQVERDHMPTLNNIGRPIPTCEVKYMDRQ